MEWMKVCEVLPRRSVSRPLTSVSIYVYVQGKHLHGYFDYARGYFVDNAFLEECPILHLAELQAEWKYADAFDRIVIDR
jgi:hypothetical protein